MIALRTVRFLPLVIAAILVAGCDGIATGEQAQTLPVSENDAGGYGPITLALTPEMAPVAINLRAVHGADPAEQGKWNSYRATLSKDGQQVAAGQFNVNHTGSPDSPTGAPSVLRNMLTAYPAEPGDYELIIAPTKAVEVKLTDTQVEVRRNVQGDVNVH